ncbi:MAG: calcium-binding protein [Pseudomonadota bacterium]
MSAALIMFIAAFGPLLAAFDDRGSDDTDDMEGGETPPEGDTLAGGDATADLLEGTAGNDLIDGLGGADTLSGGDGADTVQGGAGFDILSGGLGDDVVSGGADADLVSGNEGADTLYGGTEAAPRDASEDTLDGGDGDDVLFLAAGDAGTGGTGADSFQLTEGENGQAIVTDFDPAEDALVVNVAAGEEVSVDGQEVTSAGVVVNLTSGASFLLQGLTEEISAETVSIVQAAADESDVQEPGEEPGDQPAEQPGAALDQTLTGSDMLGDSLTGGAGNDTLSGLGMSDTLSGGAGDDLLSGGPDNDTLDGGAGLDTLVGGSGGDLLEGAEGADELDGGAGGDLLDGGDGTDSLNGGTGADTLFGGAGDDSLTGGVSDEAVDTLDGGAGADLFALGDGDIATGGDGADVFGLSGDAQVRVRVTDFDPAFDSVLVTGTDPELNVTGQTLSEDGVDVQLSNGTVIVLEGLTAEIAPDLIVFQITP